MKKSISYNGAKAWNNLPRCVKTSDATIRQFKNALDRKSVLHGCISFITSNRCLINV